jgi:hypothetical protein
MTIVPFPKKIHRRRPLSVDDLVSFGSDGEPARILGLSLDGGGAFAIVNMLGTLIECGDLGDGASPFRIDLADAFAAVIAARRPYRCAVVGPLINPWAAATAFAILSQLAVPECSISLNAFRQSWVSDSDEARRRAIEFWPDRIGLFAKAHHHPRAQAALFALCGVPENVIRRESRR